MSGGVPGDVRRAEARDEAGVAALWSALNDRHAAVEPALALRPGADLRLPGRFRAQLRDPDFAMWVCEEAGERVGFCCARFERAPEVLVERSRVEITEIAVRGSARRRGVGRALAGAALGWAAERGVRRVEVRVATGNAEGQAFWRALDFGDLMDVLHRRL